MRQWMVLYRKEMTEMWRSGRWLWVPVVFLLLGVMNPVTSYYLPDILKNAGNLPEGAVIEIPSPTPPEVMVESLSQYGTLGLLILVLATMGVVASERTSGIASMIMVKPVRHANFITAKWAGMVTLGMASFLLGYGGAWYYTEFLIGHVDPARAIAGFAVYSLWLVFILTVTLLASTWLRAGGAVAFVTLFAAAVLSILSGMFSKYIGWSPGRLADHAGAYLMKGEALASFGWSIGFTLVAIMMLLTAAVRIFRTQELPE